MKYREFDQEDGSSLSGHFHGGESDEFKDRLKLVIGKESVRSFAGRAGVSPTVVRHYVIGKSLPTLDNLIALTKAAKINLLWLATGEGPQKEQEDRKDQQVSTPVLDIKTLRLAIETVEQAFSEKGVTMDPDKKAALVAAIYELYSGSGSLEKTPVLRLIKTMT
ncbi:MAG: helix-turn-helix transcriptional regulator [Candidatus Competibacter denitrificans]